MLIFVLLWQLIEKFYLKAKYNLDIIFISEIHKICDKFGLILFNVWRIYLKDAKLNATKIKSPYIWLNSIIIF